MKYLALVLTLVCAIACAAKEPAKKPVAAPVPVGPASDASIRELLVLIEVQKDFAEALAQFEQEVVDSEKAGVAAAAQYGEPLNARHKAALAKFKNNAATLVRQKLDWAKLEPELVGLYRGNYTQQEMDGIIAFLKSPIGRAYHEKERRIIKKAETVIVEPLKQKLGLYAAALIIDLQDASDVIRPDQRVP